MKTFMKYFKLRSLLVAIALCAGAGDALAHPPNVDIRVGVRPPPMRMERVPAPRAGYAWSHGYWGWNGGTHVWYGGHWEAARPGYRYYDARWLFVDGAWAFYPAYWEPYAVAPVVVQPAPVIVQQPAQTVYVEKPSGAAPAGMDPHFWYYCRNPAGYYPYVQSCAGGWQQVTPQPQSQPQ